MTDNEKPTKNEGLLSFIANVIKKSADLPQDVSFLAGSVDVLAKEVNKMAHSFIKITKMLNHHNKVISEIIEVQNFILQNMKEKSQSSNTLLPDIHRDGTNKPN